MDRFNNYAQYYDLLYSDKDYQKEVDYVNSLIRRHSKRTNHTILDLGCGTGIHANLFTKLGCRVDGVDMSSKMIGLAKERYANNDDLNFCIGNILEFNNNKRYDVVTSLFHVISYQNTNAEIVKAFKTAYDHLMPDGIFIFDFWYGPAVLTERPEYRIKVLEDDALCIKRHAAPQLQVNNNVVEVNYEIEITSKKMHIVETINEVHSMRYFFNKEMEFYLENAGFVVENFFEWMTFKDPDINSWNVVIVAKKLTL